MVAVAAIVAGIARSSWRDLRSLGSFTGNNLFAVIALMMAEEPVDRPSSTAFFYFLIGLLYLFPLAIDVVRQVPPVRFALWPLNFKQRAAIYAATLICNPMLIIALLFASLSREPSVGRMLFAAGVTAPILASIASVIFKRAPAINLFTFIPRFPGLLGGLIQAHVRESLGMLDFYFAAVLSLGGLLYRIYSPHPDPMAPLVIGHLVVILLSTMAQTLYGTDAAAMHTRLQILPLSGVQILLAKDASWLLLVLVLAWPSPILPILAASAAALAVGHSVQVKQVIPQRRWRFAQGSLAPTGIVQMVALVAAGASVNQLGARMLPVVAAAYLVSLFWYGRSRAMASEFRQGT